MLPGVPGKRGVGVDGEELIEAAGIQISDRQRRCLGKLPLDADRRLQSVGSVQTGIDLVDRRRGDAGNAASWKHKRLCRPGKQVGLLMTNCCWVMPFNLSACRSCSDWKRS